MKKISMMALFALGCATTPAPAAEMAGPTTATWDDAAAQEVRAEFERMAHMWETLDLDGIKNLLTDDGFLTSFDLDMENKPIRMPTRDDAVRYASELLTAVKQMGGSTKVDSHALDCRATSTLAYCVMEFDFIGTMADGTKMTQPSRVTGIFRKSEDGWKWVHWHTSLASLPTPPAPPAAPPAAALSAMGTNLAALKWAPVPHVDGGEMAVVWENPNTHAQGAYFRFSKDLAPIRHFHNSSLYVHVIKGEFDFGYPDGRKYALKAGGTGFQPGKEIHTTSIKKGSLFFTVLTDGPFDLVPVDEQGKPLPPPPAAAAPAPAK